MAGAVFAAKNMVALSGYAHRRREIQEPEVNTNRLLKIQTDASEQSKEGHISLDGWCCVGHQKITALGSYAHQRFCSWLQDVPPAAVTAGERYRSPR